MKSGALCVSVIGATAGGCTGQQSFKPEIQFVSSPTTYLAPDNN